MAGIYIHIPFCKKQCSYCDFHFSTTFEAYRDELIDCLIKEISLRNAYLQGEVVKTIYFGGGTPSLLSKPEISLLLDAVSTYFELDNELEITLEANPDDITSASLNTWKSAGINRLSIGLQSFKASDLQWMNRAHTAEESEKCVSLARAAGFEHLTVDLMYGLPDLTDEEWQNHIQKVVDMGVNHISAYCLTIEEKTPLNKWVQNGKIIPSTEDQQSRQFMILLETLEKNGFDQYEISNFARAGHESQHNSNYWKGQKYLGIGPSAHSFDSVSRSWNVSHNRKYIQGISSNSPNFETEILSIKDQFNERILTGLRTIYGVSTHELHRLHPIPEALIERASSFIEQGWMIAENDGKWVLTKQGKLRADYVAAELFLD